ncbi:SNARE associated Golgi protein [compost metagenome]
MLVASYGLTGVFVMALFEKFIPVIPSYLMLMILGMSANSLPQLAGVLIVSALGSTLASAVWYQIGDFLGDNRVRRAISRYGRYVFFTVDHYDRLGAAYKRNTFLVSFAGQGVPVARIYLALPAGVMRVGFRRFVAAATLGTLVYNLAFLLVGHALRGSGHDPLMTGLLVAAALVAAEVMLFAFIRRRGV